MHPIRRHASSGPPAVAAAAAAEFEDISNSRVSLKRDENANKQKELREKERG